MAHNAQRVFVEAVKDVYPEFFKGGRVLEVGSLDINGTVRDFFAEPDQYLGIDVGPGPGVDVVISGAEITTEDGYFDVTISAECFEHNPVWRETFNNMVRMTRDGGLIVFTCAGTDRPEHGTSRSDIGSSPLTVGLGWDYYRNLTPADFSQDDLDGLSYRFYENSVACDLYFVATKNDSLRDVDLESIDWVTV